MTNDIMRESALEWVANHTTVDVTLPLPASVELFIEKYGEIMSVSAGVNSESIAGLSQSFRTSDIGTLLRQYAKELIGQEYMKSDVTVFPFVDRWV